MWHSSRREPGCLMNVFLTNLKVSKSVWVRMKLLPSRVLLTSLLEYCYFFLEMMGWIGLDDDCIFGSGGMVIGGLVIGGLVSGTT